jgi:predicted DNA-binding transcriptional regulator YafY
MPRGDQFGRQWMILKKLEHAKFGVSVKELHDYISFSISCGERTILRDIETLETGGIPIYTDEIDGITKYFVTENFLKKLSEIPFTLTEVIAIYLSYSYLKCLTGTAFHDSMNKIYEKIKCSLPPKMLKMLADIEGSFHAGYKSTKDYTKNKKTIEMINSAVLERKVIEIVYGAISTGEDSVRKVEPYMIWLARDILYLIGYCHLRKDFRTFAIHRIKSIRLLNEVFSPCDFSFDDYVKDTFDLCHGEVKSYKIWIDKTLKDYIKESVIHVSQNIEEDKEGNIILSFETGGEERVIGWVLSMGSLARLIEPKDAVNKIEDEIKKMGEIYTSSSEASSEVPRH